MDKVLERKGDFHLSLGNKRVVKKHVAAIHCSNKLSLLERRASNALLFHAMPFLKKTLSHKIRLAELKNLLGFNSRNHAQLKRAVIRLTEVTVRWNLCGDKIDGESDEWFSASLLASIHHKDGYVFYEYSGLVQSMLVDPCMYGKINLTVQSKFRSGYALALYENCSRYRGLGQTRAFDIDLFRELLGVGHNTYKKFSELRKRVLLPAVREINTKADISIEPLVVRSGRKVVAIKFSIADSMSSSWVDKKDDCCQASFVLGISNEELSKVIRRYGKDRVSSAITQLKSTQQYKSGSVSNIGAYLRAILKNEREEGRAHLKKKVVEIKKFLDEDARGEHERYESGAAFELCRKLPNSEKRKIEIDFLKKGMSFHRRNTKAILSRGGGLDNPILYDRDGGGVIAFLRASRPGLLAPILDLKTFMKKKKAGIY
jgi:plasmid replication initiation protein